MKVQIAIVLMTSSLAYGNARAQATDREVVAGTAYERVGGRWFLEDSRGELWEVAIGTIRVTFSAGISGSAIDEFSTDNAFIADLPNLSSPSVRYYQYSSSSDPVDVLKRALTSSIVESALLDTYLKPQGVPDDPYYDRQWNLRRMELDRAWDITGGDPDVTIAVIDWGVQYDHEDLAGSTWHNPAEIDSNGIDDDGNGFVDDIVGWDFIDDDNDPRPEEVPGQVAEAHGVACAGIVGAVTNNSTGIAGVSSGAA